MALGSLIWSVFFEPVFWVTTTVIWQSLILLSIFVTYRAFATLFVLWLPVQNWFRRRQLQKIHSSQLVMVTGATSGIGLAVAKHLHKLGYSVIAAYYNSQEPGYEELKKVAKQHGRIFLIELDVRKQDSISACYKQVEELIEQQKSLHLYALINNAGLGSLQPFAWLQRKTINSLIETNLLGNLLMTREFLPLLGSESSTQESSTRRLIFVSSGLGLVPGATYATYGVTKSSQIYFAKCLNLELKKRYGIQSVAVVPHNFIKNTNICASNVKTNQAAWDELRPLERQLYEKQFKEQCDMTKKLEEATRVHQARAKISSGYSASETFFDKVFNKLKQVALSITGENTATTIEESGALDGFELALRLRDPPEVIFAGDPVFQLLTGSVLMLVPSPLSSLFGQLIAPNLYR